MFIVDPNFAKVVNYTFSVFRYFEYLNEKLVMITTADIFTFLVSN